MNCRIPLNLWRKRFLKRRPNWLGSHQRVAPKSCCGMSKLPLEQHQTVLFQGLHQTVLVKDNIRDNIVEIKEKGNYKDIYKVLNLVEMRFCCDQKLNFFFLIFFCNCILLLFASFFFSPSYFFRIFLQSNIWSFPLSDGLFFMVISCAWDTYLWVWRK